MASQPDRWFKNPKPDQAVIETIVALLQAAETGQIRAVAIVTIDPQLNVETSKAGDHDAVRKRLLAAGLIEISQVLLNDKK